MSCRRITVKTPTNIAVIKYWGKRDNDLIIPLNDSISTTLNIEDLYTQTTVEFTDGEDHLILNGKDEPLNSRAKRLLTFLREASTDKSLSQKGIKINSFNSFPTAAGLASSASGYAALAISLCELLKVDIDRSIVARLGSGSASRSVYGGWVRWFAGTNNDDSLAKQRFTETHWEDIQILVCVVSAEKKETSSTGGMQDSVRTSKKLETRWKEIVPKRMEQIEKAIQEKDFSTFASITMVDSDDFHDICETDTTPKITYMNHVSKEITRIIHAFNKISGQVKIGYTYDAGPNAVVYCEKKNLPEVLALFQHYFPSTSESFYNKSLEIGTINSQLLESIGGNPILNGIKKIIHTTIGPGPQITEELLE